MFFYDYNKILFYSLTVLPILIFLNENCYVESRAISQNYRTDDVIVTKWPTKADSESLELQEELEEKEPGWLVIINKSKTIPLCFSPSAGIRN